MVAIKDVWELEKVVNNYLERHGMRAQWTSLNHVENFYKVRTFDYDRIDSRIITMKNGRTKVVFKVNGEVTSLYK